MIVDAVRSGAAAGTVRRFDALGGAAARRARQLRRRTASGVAEAIELGRALGRLPERLVVFSIEGEDFGAGAELTAPHRARRATAADAVLAELAGLVP